jgi:manganese oxidase
MSYIGHSRTHRARAASSLTDTLQHAARSAAACAVLVAGLAWQAESQTPVGSAQQIASADQTPTISINDNRWPAGRLENGVLTLRLEARDGIWYPEGDKGPGLPVAAFAEEGGPLLNPGPLIRVPVGTDVRVTLRNSLAKPLTVFGLGQRRGLTGDSVRVEPGGVREVRFAATEPGTYYYAGKTGRAPILGRSTEDTQLNGAIIVDPPGGVTDAGDRVFVIGWWFILDSTSTSGLGQATLVINGRSWPHTERVDVAQGDSLRWRWINLTGLEHPMHLHGFYFTVDAVGDGARHTSYGPDERRAAVTERLVPGATMAISWSPNRAGNWIFHCHFAGHISHHVALGAKASPAMNGHAHHVDADAHQGAGRAHGKASGHEMAGLVLGIRVAPRGKATKPAGNYRPVRLIVRSKPNVFGMRPGYAYIMGGSLEESDTAALPLPGPTLVLEKDQPVAITVINRSQEPAAVHWHGIELESFPDGVPGWSGMKKSLLPAIPPGDSLTVRFTPPRAGTFMYHSHFNEFQQIGSGLYGSIIVLDRGKRHDPDTDRVLLVSDAGPTENLIRGPFPAAMLNGRTKPDAFELRAGVTYRFRLINIRTDYTAVVSLMSGEEPLEWRPVAKDGADLPPSQATVRPAKITFAPGEIIDVEFTPRSAGTLTLRFGMPRQGPIPEQITDVPVRVR